MSTPYYYDDVLEKALTTTQVLFNPDQISDQLCDRISLGEALASIRDPYYLNDEERAILESDPLSVGSVFSMRGSVYRISSELGEDMGTCNCGNCRRERRERLDIVREHYAKQGITMNEPATIELWNTRILFTGDRLPNNSIGELIIISNKLYRVIEDSEIESTEHMAHRRNNALVKCHACGCIHQAKDSAFYPNAEMPGNCQEQLSSMLTPGANGLSPRGRFYCSECLPIVRLRTCDHCGGTFVGNMTTADLGNEARGHICRDCRDLHYRLCRDCDEWHHLDVNHRHVGEEEEDMWGDPDDDDCIEDEDDREWMQSTEVSNSDTSSTRFLPRPVGVELETGPGSAKMGFLGEFKRSFSMWGSQHDGSIDEAAMELVSNPMSGARIETDLRDIYALLKKHGVHIWDKRAGAHVHVSVEDCWSRIKSGYASISPVTRARYDKVEDDLIEWGSLVCELCRMFVSARRAENTYCNNGFRIRPKNYVQGAGFKKIRNASYPTVAVRDKTLEFRLWPSTDSIDFMLARVELSQKFVESFNLVMNNAPRRGALLVKLDAIKVLFEVGKGYEAMDDLAKELQLSEDATTALKSIAKKYHAARMGAEPVSFVEV